MGNDYDAGNPPPENFYSRQWGARMTDLSTAHAECQATLGNAILTADTSKEGWRGSLYSTAVAITSPAFAEMARLEERVAALEAGLRAIAEYRLPLGLSAAGHARALLSGGEG
jgi:hypothetical protein